MPVEDFFRFPLLAALDQTRVRGPHPYLADATPTLGLDAPPDGEQQPDGVIDVPGVESHLDGANRETEPFAGIHGD